MKRGVASAALASAVVASSVIDFGGLVAAARTATVATTVALGKAPRVAVASAGPATAVESKADAAAPPSPGGRQSPGGSSDVVADVPLPDGGGLVAVTWPSQTPPSAAADLVFRTRTASTWSNWRHLTPDGESDSKTSGTVRYGTDPFWVPDAQQIQVRSSAGGVRDLDHGQLVVIHPGSDPAAPRVASKAVALANPGIITRAQWGANEALRNGCVPDVADTTKAAVIHHTVNSNSYSPSDSAALVRGILYYHTQSRGWCDIGYNALVDRYGQIFEGRYGGLKRSVIGAHAIGFNYRTFGVALIGDFQTVSPPQVAFTSLQNIIAYRFHDYYVDAMQSVVLTSASSESRYPAGTNVRLPVITGHRDTYYTECPGTKVWILQPNIRRETQRAADYGGSIIYQRWIREGGQATFGLVSTGESAVPFGYRTTFTNNRSIYARPGGTSQLGSGIDGYYWAKGGLTTWGWPFDEYAVPGGYRVDFAGHFAVFWSPARGSQVTNGLVLDYWNSVGGSGSVVGFPIADMQLAPNHGYRQDFSKGTVWFQPQAGGHGTYAAINQAYLGAGGPYSPLGYPVTEQRTVGSSVVQGFQGGSITVPAPGAAPVIRYF